MKIKPLLSTAACCCWLLACAVFLAVAAYYLINFHVSPLSRDQWHMYAQLFDEGLWQTSLATVSGHRHLFAFSLFWLDWQYFAGANHFLVACAWLLNALLLGLLVRTVWYEAPARTVLAVTVVLLGSWLINLALLGWGFNGINNYLSIVPSLYGLFFLGLAVQSKQRLWLGVAVACGLVATLSFGNGAVVWPAGVLLLWGMRAGAWAYGCWLLGSSAGFALYFLLPGAEVVNQSLLFNGWYTLMYPFEQLGGPVWHLLRPLPWFNSPLGMVLAKGAGYVFGGFSLAYLFRQIVLRKLRGNLALLSCALQLTGWGTLALLTITRPEPMLDISIDRFQIWALLVWLGLLLAYWPVVGFRRVLLPLALLFPLVALPSQLDWGARLAEYHNRTAQGLLSWMIALPVANDAERALHWNWQQKIEPMQQVLARAEQDQANLYRLLPPQTLGERVAELPQCAAKLERLRLLPIVGRELYQPPEALKQGVVGWRLYGELPDASRAAVLLDADRAAIGYTLPITHSLLPRSSGVRHGGYNVYGAAKANLPPVFLVRYQAGQAVCEIRLATAH